MRKYSVGIAAMLIGVGATVAVAQVQGLAGTWVIDVERTREASGQSVVAGAIVGRGGGGTVAGGRGGGVVVATGRSTAGTTSGSGAAAIAGRGGRGAGGVVGGIVVARAGSNETIIAMDNSTFTVQANGMSTTYPLDGRDVAVRVRGREGTSHVVRGSSNPSEGRIVIETTVDNVNGPVTTRTTWSLEDDALVREAPNKTYYKRK